MTIVGNTDDRTIITGQALNTDPYDSVVAIDNSAVFGQPPGVGSGIIIAPNYVLTAAHVALNNGLIPQGLRVTLSEDVATLDSRTVTSISANAHNAIVTGKSTDDFLPAPSYLPGITDKNDIGLLEIAENYSIADSSRYMGIVAYVNPLDAVERDVYTAGYPAAVRTPYLGLSKNAQFLIRNENGALIRRDIPGTGSVHLTDARTMFAATGKIESVNSINGLYTLSETIESESGQSGSGLWTFLEGDLEPRVVGIVNSSFETVDFGNGSQASPITTDVYKNIITEIGSVNGIDDASVLPENAIVGSNVADNIEGTYRKERILGNDGNDIISGGEADDRLEGGIGNDVLKGEKGNDRLQGDEGNDDLDGGEGNIDVAVFSEEYTTENYDYSISEDGEEITISHIGGTRNDGIDTLKNIEWALFESPPHLTLPYPHQYRC